MTKPDPLAITDRLFTPTERGYVLALKPIDVTFQADRLRREKQELIGELSVRVNGKLPQAQAVNGILSQGDFNFSSIRARSERAKLLGMRARDGGLDWYGFLEEFAVKILDAERKGKPAIRLAEYEPDTDQRDSWDVGGFPLLRDLPMVLYGLGDAGKSYFSMWLAGTLAERAIPVLYADWEFSKKDHYYRFKRLFQPMPLDLYYVRCERAMTYEIDRLMRLVEEHRVQYVICDSIVFALQGHADDEQAGHYFRALRQLGVGTLNLAHTSKAADDEKSIYGSVFFANGARSIWFIEKAERTAENTLEFGLFHTKCNVGSKRKPRGYKLIFGQGTTTVESTDVEDSDELSSKLPALDRIRRVLRFGPLAFGEISEKTGLKKNILSDLMRKHQTMFTKLESAGRTPRYGLAAKRETEESF